MGGRGRGRETRTEIERRQKLRLDLNDDNSGTGSRIDLEQKAFETADSRASYGLVVYDTGFCSLQLRSFKLWNNFDSFSIVIIGISIPRFFLSEKSALLYD